MTMMRYTALFALLTLPGLAIAAEPPSYAKQVRPFLARYCLECHNGTRTKGDLNLETFQGMLTGGKHGPAVVPGKPDESQLVLSAEHKAKPFMPPKRQRQPEAAEVGLLRAWVAAGAKDDSATVKAVIPEIRPRVPVAPAVTALAYRPDGKILAAGMHREVALIDVATGDVVGKLPGQLAKVTALAFSGDGKRLAVASGSPASTGEVRLYALDAAGVPPQKAGLVIPAHQDLIYDVAFSPDGKTLATCGYDRLIKLWDAADGKELRTLKDHSDAVYAVAWSPDGRRLASASADRAVKIWNADTGARLVTLSDNTDWVYAVAWSADGRHVAAGGVDRSIRVWDLAAGNRLVHSVFAHEGPVARLVYSADGKSLYSLGEDRAAKAWDAETMTERRAYPRQSEAVLSLALRPDRKQLALGRYDGALVLLDETAGKVQSQPLPAKPKPPQVTRLSPTWARRGGTVRVTFEGNHLDTTTELTATGPGITGKVVAEGRGPHSVQVDVTLPATLPPGVYSLSLKNPAGQSKPLPLTVDAFAAVAEAEPNDAASSGQPVTLPVAVAGALQRPGDVDFYRFEAKAGQELGVQAVLTGTGTKPDPVLVLLDGAAHVLAETGSGVLGYTFSRPGTYALGIRDRDYRGGPEMTYRLQAGDLPVVTGVFPLGLQRGTEAEVRLEGVNLGGIQSVRMKAPPDAAPGSRLPVSVTTPQGPPLGNPTVVVGEFPESARPGALTVPGTANGHIDRPGATEAWRFPAKKGQRLLVEVEARRLGSPLDSFVEILDVKGRPVPWVLLQCQSRTYVTFRDHDSVGAGIRIETWNDLAMNDYLYGGSELMRIWALPKNPDDDCQFYSSGGQRLAFYGTTPTHHSLGTPLYKVALYPPGTALPPNGLPVIALDYRNDDGGPGYGKDSRLFFDPPADGEYQVRVGDSSGRGGAAYAYRLTVRPPRPSFEVSFSPTAPAVWKGGAVPVTVSARRIDGYDGPIEVRLENLPSGFRAPATTVPAGEENTTLALWADADARPPGKVPPLKLVARSVIDGKPVVREAAGGVPSLAEPGDLVTTAEQSEVTVRPGGQVHLTVKIDRRNGFAGRVPLDVKGLPHGVHVLDIGLNGILITEKETARTITIACEPWVEPTEHPFVVLSRSERKNTEHAAKSVLLRVVR
ncbi:MAG TPA: c-type cytochrome domain-containing protein [Gemmataceae bacterium]|nr:c-type cytochrome domain-containing protein [Gemmataceae bacterium]